MSYDRISHCTQVVMHSKEYSIDPTIAVSVLLVESKGKNPTPRSSRGPRGPMQITPYWCKKQTFSNCNLLKAGVRALYLLRQCYTSGIDWETQECTKRRSTPKPWLEVFCTYNTGVSCAKKERGQLYSRNVFRTKTRVGRIKKRMRVDL